MELQFFEKLIITGLRKFNKFFNMHNYSISGMSFGDRDGDFIRYKSNDSGFEIHIVFTNTEKGVNFDLIFYKKAAFSSKKFFSLNDSYTVFPEIKNIKKIISEENYDTIIESYYQFVSKYLLSVVQGDKWIEDFK